jgi:hypothetical protein
MARLESCFGPSPRVWLSVVTLNEIVLVEVVTLPVVVVLIVVFVVVFFVVVFVVVVGVVVVMVVEVVDFLPGEAAKALEIPLSPTESMRVTTGGVTTAKRPHCKRKSRLWAFSLSLS